MINILNILKLFGLAIFLWSFSWIHLVAYSVATLQGSLQSKIDYVLLGSLVFYLIFYYICYLLVFNTQCLIRLIRIENADKQLSFSVNIQLIIRLIGVWFLLTNGVYALQRFFVKFIMEKELRIFDAIIFLPLSISLFMIIFPNLCKKILYKNINDRGE